MIKFFYVFKKNPFLVFTVILSFFVVFLGYSYINLNIKCSQLNDQVDQFENRFELLSPNIAKMNTETFLEQQKNRSINYWKLKDLVLKEMEKHPDEDYGFYFEDLSTGSWIGINEKEKFLPRSLFKVPLMVSILKKVEDGEISLEQKVKITLKDIDYDEGNSVLNRLGMELTVQELLAKMIQESDNTAMKTLANNFVNDEDYSKTISMMGLYVASKDQSVSPKEYINMFRSLYFSTYLRRPFSEYALSLLAGTKFTSQLPAGLPEGLKISHKVGFDYVKGYYHDCGIVYLPNHHYSICVMSQNTTSQRADEVISKISKIVYDFNSNLE